MSRHRRQQRRRHGRHLAEALAGCRNVGGVYSLDDVRKSPAATLAIERVRWRGISPAQVKAVVAKAAELAVRQRLGWPSLPTYMTEVDLAVGTARTVMHRRADGSIYFSKPRPADRAARGPR